MIWELMNPSFIFPNLAVRNYEDVMAQIGGALTREGYTKESYVEALIEREKEFPTGLDVDGYGVAIPHTPVEHVNKTAIAFAVLENPVEFTAMGTDDEFVQVKLVMMLAIAGKPGEHGAHIDELQRIMAILQDTALLDKLQNAKSADEIIHLVKEKEKSL